MNKTELVAKLATNTGLPKAQIARVVDGLFDDTGVISQALRRGDEVSIAGFGVFAAKDRAARAGRNPATGESIQIAAKRTPAFRPGKTLRDVVAR